MTEDHTFEGRIEPLEWGKSTYTILRLPPDIADALAAQGAKRVEGEIADHPVNLALTTAPVVEGTFLWTGQSLLDAAGLTPGAPVDVRLRMTDPDAVDTPDDVAAALRAAGKSDLWHALTAGKRRGMLYHVTSAKRPETRAKRIAKLLTELT